MVSEIIVLCTIDMGQMRRFIISSFDIIEPFTPLNFLSSRDFVRTVQLSLEWSE